jgi:hypothetical protein
MAAARRFHPYFYKASCLDATKDYISREKERANTVAAQFDSFEGILIWGAGDNFRRSIQHGGPLSSVRNMVVLDRRPQQISMGGKTYVTVDPKHGIHRYPWPVVIAVSEGKRSICDQVIQIDPNREVFFL